METEQVRKEIQITGIKGKEVKGGGGI